MFKPTILTKLEEARGLTRSPAPVRTRAAWIREAEAINHLLELTADWNASRAKRSAARRGELSAPAIEAERASLRQMMADPRGDYWHGPSAEAHQARYRELLAHEGSNDSHDTTKESPR